jgi:hypothetical protein
MASNRIARLHVAPITLAQETIPTVMESIFVRYKPRLRIIVLAVLLSATVGCGNSTIVGKWHMSGGSGATIWEFSKNGAVVIGNTRGRYTLDRKRVKIETPFAKTVYQMEFSGDRMTLREPGGPKLEFTRIREDKS